MEKIVLQQVQDNPEYIERIGIITDEAADLPKDIIEKYQIAVVPVKMDWPEIENLPGENTFQKMRELEKRGIKSFGKTSQPSPKDFLDQYKYQLERFDKIICITITSKLSGTYNSAIQAKNFLEIEKQEKVFIIDSLSVTGGQTLLILKAIGLIQEGEEDKSSSFPFAVAREGEEDKSSSFPFAVAREGKEIKEIIKELEEFVPQIHLYVMLEDPKWIEALGRISHLVANLMRGLAKVGIRPVLTLKSGVLVPAGVKTGAKEMPVGLLKQLEADIKKFKMEDRKIRVIITHGDNLEGAQKLKEMIWGKVKNAEIVFLNIINNVVGVPAGPNALTIAWCEI